MMTAIGDDGKPIGYFLLRNADWNAKSIHIGFIVVDSSKRHSGYGKQMVKLAIRYCFDILGMERITLGVFHVNSRAMNCYEAIGFTPYGMEETFLYKGREWKIIEMEYLKSYE